MKKLYAAAMVAALTSGFAQAASWTTADPTAVKVENQTITYSPTASAVWVYDDNLVQSPADIEVEVETLLGLPATGAGSLQLVDSEDSLDGEQAGRFTIDASFTYLALHIGQNEILFKWDQPLAAGTVFEYSNLPRGASNFRAFNTVSAVPEPTTYLMLGLGLGLIGFMARRKS